MTSQAHGELGQALLALADRLGGRAKICRAIRAGEQSLSRWVRGDTVPDARFAARLCEIEPALRPILEAKRAFIDRRKRPPLGRGAMTRQKAQERRDGCMVDVEAARAEIAACELPRVPAQVKEARLALIESLAPAHTKRARIRRALARKRANKSASNVGYEERTGRMRGRRRDDDALDFLSGLTPSYAMEDLR